MIINIYISYKLKYIYKKVYWSININISIPFDNSVFNSNNLLKASSAVLLLISGIGDSFESRYEYKKP